MSRSEALSCKRSRLGVDKVPSVLYLCPPCLGLLDRERFVVIVPTRGATMAVGGGLDTLSCPVVWEWLFIVVMRSLSKDIVVVLSL